MAKPLEDRLSENLVPATQFLLSQIGFLEPENQERITEALFAAAAFHDGQYRKGGKIYLIHPIQVASIVASLHCDSETIIAALLHDVVEDTHGKPRELERRFGQEVRLLVEALTKHAAFSHREYAEKLYLRSQEDGRIAIIKVADCCANLMKHSQNIFPPIKHLEHITEATDLYQAWLVSLPGFPIDLRRMLDRIIKASILDYETRPDSIHDKNQFTTRHSGHPTR